ncbi:MAG: hypothetical protein FJ279_24115, partial [Planctomycetes bacterium]|nr:hypothetical protein [Planctomycetota bacterium]
PVDDQTVRPLRLVGYGGHGICMAWFGLTDSQFKSGVMAIIETPDDMSIQMLRDKDGRLTVQPIWEASRGEFAYPRRIRYVFFTDGGYVAQAKRYREYAKSVGLFKSLRQKLAENPNVDSLMGAVNVWNWEPKKAELCEELKSLGVKKALWSGGGTAEQVARINALGYLTSRYDIYQDVYDPNMPDLPKHLKERLSAGWPDDLVLLPNGDWMKGWASHVRQKDGTKKIFQGGVICSSRGLLKAKEAIPKELASIPFRGRFIDTTTASPWRECWNPAHPLTRSQDREFKMKLLELVSKDMKLVCGSETGHDASVPFTHFYEGMMSLGPYRLPDAGRNMLEYKEPTPDFLKYQVGPYYRAPLWELVYHDCTVAYWYWGDYNNKAPEVWDQRDLFNILYATPPMWMFNAQMWAKHKERFLQCYRNTCPQLERLGYEELLTHEFLTPDHAVQRTRFADGTTIVVNFSDKDHDLGEGRVVKARGFSLANK